MIKEVTNRLIVAIPTMLGCGILVFFILRLTPGDAVDAMFSDAEAFDPQVAVQLRQLFGLDKPLPEQFASWFSSVIRGDLGTSIRTRRPVAQEILSRFPATFELAMGALLVSIVIALPLGVISATRRNTWTDLIVRFTSLMGASIPNFWLALLLLYLFAVILRILPAGGYAAIAENPLENLKFAFLPIMTLGVPMAAGLVRQVRAQLLEVLNLEYVRTARAKGLRERAVVYGHALRNSLIPVVTILGLRLGGLLGGTVIIEQIFSWPGIGQMTLRAIQGRDYPMVQGGVLILAFFYVMANLLVDIMYTYLDPRLKKS